jgi:DNA-binding NarL/FixJ family response regulator
MGTRVFLVDDHNIFRESLKLLLESAPDIEIVGETGESGDALALIKKKRPDIVIMDVAMPGLNGIEITRKITAQLTGIKVIALSAYSERKSVLRMFKAGAVGYLIKDCVFKELVYAIKAVARGQTYVSPQIADIVVDGCLKQSAKDARSNFCTLTDREREVLQLIAEGKTTKEIAFQFKVSLKTIETHRAHIMEKLKINSVAGLTKYAIREGISFL